jgi:cation:H+ antiporter
MALVGISALLYVKRRPQGRGLNAHMPTLERDLIFFMAFFALGLALGQGAPTAVQIPAAIACFLAYVVYARWTVMHSGEVQAEQSLDPLIMSRGIGARGSEAAGAVGGAAEDDEPSVGLIVLQMLIGLGAMVAGAHLFVHELLWVAEELGASALVLSLVLAPLATELPEKANSFFWVREGKDSLALGNITGAMVFQSTIPIGIGLAFTDWELTANANLSIVLGLLGGAVAYVALHRRARFSTPAILAWALLYLVFIGVVAF